MTGATQYTVWVQDQTTGAVVINNPNVSGTTWTSTLALTPGDSYIWYVGGSSSSRGLTWSKGQTFTLNALAVPVPQAGPSGALAPHLGYDMPTLSWNAVAGADHYDVWISDLTTGSVAVNADNITDTLWISNTGLTPGHNYKWWVGAVSSNGKDVPWTAGQTFSLGTLEAPTGLSGPTGTVAAATGYDLPNLQWNPVAAASNYYIWIYDQTTKTVAVNNPSVSGTTWVPTTALTPGHSYTWWVGSAVQAARG